MKLIAVEEHFLTPQIRAAWAASPFGQEGTAAFDRGEIDDRLNDLGQGRIALMDESGVDVQVLSVTTPALHNLEAEESVMLAKHQRPGRRHDRELPRTLRGIRHVTDRRTRRRRL